MKALPTLLIMSSLLVSVAHAETAGDRLDAAERASQIAQTEVCQAVYQAQESSALPGNRGFPGPKATQRLRLTLTVLSDVGPTVLTAESQRMKSMLISRSVSARQVASAMSYLLTFLDCSNAAAPEVAD